MGQLQGGAEKRVDENLGEREHKKMEREWGVLGNEFPLERRKCKHRRRAKKSER